MTFKSAVIVSIVLHVSLGAIAILTPATRKSGETTYYVDLIQTGGGGTGGRGGGGQQEAAAANKAKAPEPQSGASLLHEPSGRMRDLTVNQSPKSSLRYPDKEGRKKAEPEKLISVQRKDRLPAPPASGNVPAGKDGLTMGISTGSGGSGSGGDGSGSGFGAFFPYAYYVEALKGKISSSWYSSLVSPGLKGKYLTTVYFKIHRNGEVSELRIEKSSGVNSLDLSALRAVSNATPFGPLPGDFPDSYLVVHFEFEWEK